MDPVVVLEDRLQHRAVVETREQRARNGWWVCWGIQDLGVEASAQNNTGA